MCEEVYKPQGACYAICVLYYLQTLNAWNPAINYVISVMNSNTHTYAQMHRLQSSRISITTGRITKTSSAVIMKTKLTLPSVILRAR